MMCPPIDNPASCGLRPERNEWRNCKTMVYDVQRGRINVQDEERSGRPSVVSDGLVQSVGQKICERRRFTI
jgi:hypothetical protein